MLLLLMNIFTGIKVIELADNLAGPYPGAMLADFGADVIKIERPFTGDTSRAFFPNVSDMSAMFAFLNRGKRSLVLDLKDPEGVAIARKLIADADIVLECNRPGVIEQYGLNYEALTKIKADIIMCRVSAFGQTGPWKDLPGHDLMAQAVSGAMDATGEPDGPPVKHGFALSAYAAGLYAFGAISAALFHRERTGEGQYIDISLFDSLFSMNDYIEPAALGHNVSRSGSSHALMAPFGVFEGTGGALTIAAVTPKAWKALCRVTQTEHMLDDPRFKDAGTRLKHIDLLTAMITKWLQSFDNIDTPSKLLTEAGVPNAKIMSAIELLENEQLAARDMYVELDAAGTKIKARGNPVKLSAATPHAGRSPSLGEHQQEILAELGYSADRITQLMYKWSV